MQFYKKISMKQNKKEKSKESQLEKAIQKGKAFENLGLCFSKKSIFPIEKFCCRPPFDSRSKAAKINCGVEDE
jgi:hypothetical protein